MGDKYFINIDREGSNIFLVINWLINSHELP